MQLQGAIINIVGEIRDFSTVLSIELKSKHYTGSKIFKFDANSKTVSFKKILEKIDSSKNSQKRPLIFH